MKPTKIRRLADRLNECLVADKLGRAFLNEDLSITVQTTDWHRLAEVKAIAAETQEEFGVAVLLA